MIVHRLILLAGIGSVGLLIGALLFQYLGDMQPCKMCYWQRYPHIAAAIFSVAAVLTKLSFFVILGLVSTLTSAVIGAFHAGVEQAWWNGPQSCTSGSIDKLSTDELLAQIMSAPIVRCDEIPWEMLGISMAGWNMVLSFALTVVWGTALRKQFA